MDDRHDRPHLKSHEIAALHDELLAAPAWPGAEQAPQAAAVWRAASRPTRSGAPPISAPESDDRSAICAMRRPLD